jgi:hypothetical protein
MTSLAILTPRCIERRVKFYFDPKNIGADRYDWATQALDRGWTLYDARMYNSQGTDWVSWGMETIERLPWCRRLRESCCFIVTTLKLIMKEEASLWQPTSPWEDSWRKGTWTIWRCLIRAQNVIQENHAEPSMEPFSAAIYR